MRSRLRIFPAMLFVFVSLLVLETVVSQAAPPRRPVVKKGEKIEVKWHFDWLPAEVISVDANSGWINAKFKETNGSEREWKFPPDNCRRPEKTTPTSAKPAAADEDENPFESQDPKENRTWTDSTGKFKIEAQFVELKDGKVALKKADGSTIKLALEKLSAPDQRIARKFSGEEVPDARPETPTDASDAKPDGEYPYKTIAADWSSITPATLDEVTASVPPDAAKSSELKPKRIQLQPRSWNRDEFFENVQRMVMHGETSSAAIIHVNAAPGKPRKVRLERCDLAGGKSMGSVDLSTPGTPFDIDPSGTRLLCVNEWPGKFKHIEIWKIESKGAVHEVSFLPTDTASPHAVNLNTSDAGFIDVQTIWTLDSMGKLVVWNYPEAKAIYSLSFPLNIRPTLSANRKYLGVSLPTGTYVIDARTGATVSRMEGTPVANGQASFSENGQMLAAVSSGQVRVWDLATGKMKHDVYFPRPVIGRTVNFLEDGFVLVDGQYLIDLAKRMMVWEYQIHSDMHNGQKAIRSLGGLTWFQVSAQDRSSKGVYALSLPHEEAKKAAAAVDVTKSLVIQPGASLDVRGQFQNPQDTQKMGEILYNRIQDMGMTVTRGAPLWLEATVTQGQTKNVTYESIGFGRGSETVSVTEQHCRLAIMEGGKTLWEVKGTMSNTPFMVFNNKEENLQTKLQKDNANSVESFFRNTTIPTYLMRHPDSVVFGASAVNQQGMTTTKSTFQQQAEQAKQNPPGGGGVPGAPGAAPGNPGPGRFGPPGGFPFPR